MKFGAHMSTGGGVWKALERGASINCEIVQIFVKNCMERFNCLWLFTLVVVLLAGCSSSETKVITSTDRNDFVIIDSKNRVSQMTLHSPDGSVRIKGTFDYKGHQLKLARFFDSQGKEVCRGEFENHRNSSVGDALSFSSSFRDGSDGLSDVAEWKIAEEVIFKHVFVRRPSGREGHETFGPDLVKLSASE